MSLKTSDIDHIIGLVTQIAEAATKTCFLSSKEKKLLDDYRDYEECKSEIATAESIVGKDKSAAKKLEKLAKEKLKQIKTPYDGNKAKRLKRKLGDKKLKHLDSVIKPLQEKLDLYLAPLWPALNKLSFQPKNLQKLIWRTFLSGNIMSLENNIVYDNKAMMLVEFAEIERIKEKTERELNRIRAKIEYDNKKQAETPASGGEAGDAKETGFTEVSISKLIEQGESHTLEFKERLECDAQKEQKSKGKDFPSLKTIAGFLNASGGTLLIGVDDSGKIKGIEPDLRIIKQGNNDKFEQKIRNYLRDRFEPYPIDKVKVSFEKFMEGTVCRIDVQADKDPVNLDNELYVRDGNTTQLLKGRRLTDWIQQSRQANNQSSIINRK